MNKSKGFTIIELLVVVAIIAVLTGIVLVNVTSYINKGKDAAIQGNLSSLTTNAAAFYDSSTNGFTGFCAGTTAVNPIAAAKLAFANPVQDTADCFETAVAPAIAWAACSQLKVTDSYFCTDSTGAKKIIGGRASCVAAWNLGVCP